MNKRIELEKMEFSFLSDRAMKSALSKGRLYDENKCELRTDFQRDRDRIVHSKAFRRLMHKTQVFLSPEGDHYRTRLTHTLEVSQIARTIARALSLNEDLTEAISLGHDLGHTPFGHNGEEVLNSVHKEGFLHNVQSLRVVDKLESNGSRIGLNLTYEVRDGILNHTSSTKDASTLEGQIVCFSDRIAYINHDIDDALRSGVIKLSDLPKSSLELFGKTHHERINSMVKNIVISSDQNDCITMSDEYLKELNNLRDFMFENVYRNPIVKKEADLSKVEMVIKSLYNYFVNNPNKLPDDLQVICSEEGPNVAAKDYVAGMTDRFALTIYNDLFVPKGWK